MRLAAVSLLLFSSITSGCASLKRMLPEGPATNSRLTPAAAAVTYTSQPVSDTPVLPLLVWGAAYDLDLVIVSDHPEWNMHEYARILTPEGPVWMAKDARESTMSQSIVADIPNIEALWPEIPVQRKSWPVEVVDRSTDTWLDLEFRYENIDGEPVEVTYQGKVPRSRQGKRNGSTMGHSRDSLMAVLDLPLRNFAKSASISINGEQRRITRILGLVPFKMALTQTQGGLASGSFRQEGLVTRHGTVPLTWERDGDDLVQRHPVRTLRYHFVEGELTGLTATQYGRDEPTTHIAISPALPDLRRRFEGRHTSRFLVDIDGQQGHALGRLEASWGAEGPHVDLIPEKPWWVADRPMRTTIRFDDTGADITIERI